MEQQGRAWTPQEGRRRVVDLLDDTFGRGDTARVWASPGRVNLIGEHTDYNDGLCLPIALPHRTYVAAVPRPDGRVRMTTDLGEAAWEGDLTDLAPGQVTGWAAYAGGPAWALRQDGIDVPGFDLAIASCVPLGAGLSSSAAIECAVGLALADLAGVDLTDDEGRARLAGLCVTAENEVAGAPTGGMDQAASLRTREGHALLLDCSDESVRHVPFDLDAAGLALLVVDTRAPHRLVDGRYGERRDTCRAAAARLGVFSLREVHDEEAALARLDDDVERRRARHVVTEIRRVEEFVEAARSGAWERAGALMNASHASLRDDYEVSCPELDTAVGSAVSAGALGARMTGGGFGGSAIALVRAADVDRVGQAVVAGAQRAGLATPELHLATPSAPGGRVGS